MQTPQDREGGSRFDRIWPMATIGVCLIATIGWLGFLIFGIIKMVERAF